MSPLDGVYAARLITVAERIVGAVHGDGPNELLAAVDRALAIPAPKGTDSVVALVTVLAAMVDPDTTTDQRLGWVRAFDQTAEPAAGRQLKEAG